tara:strand:- start:3005 stop:3781 length:777 start_codon:yes stop_codon:yes gene_type:complete
MDKIEITTMTIPKNSQPIDDKDKVVISDILNNFSSFCHINKKVSVRQESIGFRNDPPESDIIDNINKTLISDFIPGTDKKTFHLPYNKIDRKIFFSKKDNTYTGFLLASYDIDLLKPYFESKYWRSDQKFNEIKYKTILNTTEKVKEKFHCDVKLVWLELLCVKVEFRKNNISKILVDKLIEDVVNTYGNDESVHYIIIAIDIPGTSNDWYNLSLANFYEKNFNFKISYGTGMEIISGGTQLGYIQLKREGDIFYQTI